MNRVVSNEDAVSHKFKNRGCRERACSFLMGVADERQEQAPALRVMNRIVSNEDAVSHKFKNRGCRERACSFLMGVADERQEQAPALRVLNRVVGNCCLDGKAKKEDT